MRSLACVLGWLAAFPGCLLVIIGVLTWPPGGLMFALPFVFLMPSGLLLLIGIPLLVLGREPSAAAGEVHHPN
jgi:hypothetical protein